MALVCSSGKIKDTIFIILKDDSDNHIHTTIVNDNTTKTLLTTDFKQAKRYVEGLTKQTYE